MGCAQIGTTDEEKQNENSAEPSCPYEKVFYNFTFILFYELI